MRLEEFDSSVAAERRVQRMKSDAKSAKERAKQMKAKADTSAEQLKLRQSKQKLAQLHKSTVSATINPYFE